MEVMVSNRQCQSRVVNHGVEPTLLARACPYRLQRPAVPLLAIAEMLL